MRGVLRCEACIAIVIRWTWALGAQRSPSSGQGFCVGRDGSVRQSAYASAGSSVAAFDRGVVLRGNLVDGVMRLVLSPRTDHQHGARAVAGADEHVLDPGRAVQEIPLAQGTLLAFEDHEALAV